MKTLALAIGLALGATSASASTHDLTTGFSTRGECQKALVFSNYDEKHQAKREGRNPAPVNEYVHATFSCEKIGGAWYIVMTEG